MPAGLSANWDRPHLGPLRARSEAQRCRVHSGSRPNMSMEIVNAFEGFLKDNPKLAASLGRGDGSDPQSGVPVSVPMIA
jgi:hypothetical protein